jgi:hypothetical protein
MIGRSARHPRHRAAGYKRPAHASSRRAGELGGATIHGVGRHFANAIRFRVKGEGQPESLVLPSGADVMLLRCRPYPEGRHAGILCSGGGPGLWRGQA